MRESTTTRCQLAVEAGTVTCEWSAPAQAPPRGVLVLAHGAGNDMDSPFMRFFHAAAAAGGMLAMRFNFPYKERGARAPDPAARLEKTWRAALSAARERAPGLPLFVGGKSMGARYATLVAAGGERLDGIVALGYPLHPAGRPERIRDEHFTRIECPILFVQGSRDRLCDLDLLRASMAALPAPARLHVVEGGDHSYAVPKRDGRTLEDVWREAATAVDEWLGERLSS